jgi:hypothetical protein
VQDWAGRRRHTLERLVGQPIRPVELDDDRLGIVLRRLSRTKAHHPRAPDAGSFGAVVRGRLQDGRSGDAGGPCGAR